MGNTKYDIIKYNSTKLYAGGIEFDEVYRKDIKCGSGAIYNQRTFLTKYDGYTLFEKLNNGKIEGGYIKWIISKDYREFGIKKNGKNYGSCLTIENKEGYYTQYDENEDEHGFYIKFINNGYDFVIFYFNHGKLSSRCLIKVHNDIFFGQCSSLTNYKKLSEEKTRLSFYPSFNLIAFNGQNKEYPNSLHPIKKDNNSRINIGWHVRDYLEKNILGGYYYNNYSYVGELSAGFSQFGIGCRTYNNKSVIIGNFFDSSPSVVLNIDSKRCVYQEFNSGKQDGSFFSDYKDYLLIGKYVEGKLFDEILKIEKDTLNISLNKGNGQTIFTSCFPTSNTNASNNKPGIKEDKKSTEVKKEADKNTTDTKEEKKKYFTPRATEKKEEKVIKQGWQKITYNDGRYEGKYSNDLRSGHGTFYFNNNDKVEGTWENDKMNGYGTYYFANGDKYEGFFKDGLFHGRGTLTYKNGNKIVGTWDKGENKESLRSGREDYENGYYIGEFLNDERHGKGTYFFSNGWKYEGNWVHNEFTGSGKFYDDKGTVYEGYFINGKLNGFVNVYFANGDTYSGEFKDNKRHGYGKLYREDGYVYSQYWENGKRVE